MHITDCLSWMPITPLTIPERIKLHVTTAYYHLSPHEDATTGIDRVVRQLGKISVRNPVNQAYFGLDLFFWFLGPWWTIPDQFRTTYDS